ncbi:hypothetical protein CA54_30220 [Symmachiella macrocystis]|uniref:Uncharacterized protein n=1 Tax=Symmachiella macrocystis TaxID=2527985 RepID=A0A5C6BTL4_9PLAN|nr:hypothetical protein CA54_30220 [Symmachiella macrocystis]
MLTISVNGSSLPNRVRFRCQTFRNLFGKHQLYQISKHNARLRKRFASSRKKTSAIHYGRSSKTFKNVPAGPENQGFIRPSMGFGNYFFDSPPKDNV